MAMDGHDHHPGLGVGQRLRAGVEMHIDRLSSFPQSSQLHKANTVPIKTLRDLRHHAFFFFRRETGHAPSLVPNKETKTRTFIYTQI